MGKEKIETDVAKVLQRVIKKRKELRISQTELALKLHLTPNGYFKIEKGHTGLSVIRVLEIAEALKVNPHCFFVD